MSIVTLVSGGLDSTLVAVLAREGGLEQYPLFVDYGQRAKNKELSACRAVLARLQQTTLSDELFDPVADRGRLVLREQFVRRELVVRGLQNPRFL